MIFIYYRTLKCYNSIIIINIIFKSDTLLVGAIAYTFICVAPSLDDGVRVDEDVKIKDEILKNKS